jgi:hypothetical protein
MNNDKYNIYTIPIYNKYNVNMEDKNKNIEYNDILENGLFKQLIYIYILKYKY